MKELMKSWTTAEKFENDAAFAFKSKAEVDQLITHLAASAVKISIDSMRDGANPSGREANILLYYANVYMKKDADQLRKYLVNFGPFVEKDKAATVYRDGQPPLVCAVSVKWSQKKYDQHFKEVDSEQLAREMKAVTFNTWKKATKDAKKNAGKTEKELQEEEAKKITRRKEKLIKDAEDAGVSLSFAPSSVGELLAQIKKMSEQEGLSEQDKTLLEMLIETASRFYAMQKKD